MAAEGGIPDRSRGWGSQANQGKRNKTWGQAEPLCTPSTAPTITGKAPKRLSKQLKDDENAAFLSMEWRPPQLGGHRTEQEHLLGREAVSLGNWVGRLAPAEYDGDLMLRVCGGQ